MVSTDPSSFIHCVLAEIDTVSFSAAMAEKLASIEMSVEKNTAKNSVVGEELRVIKRFVLFIISSPFWRLVLEFISSRRGKSVSCYVQLCCATKQQINHSQATVI